MLSLRPRAQRQLLPPPTPVSLGSDRLAGPARHAERAVAGWQRVGAGPAGDHLAAPDESAATMLRWADKELSPGEGLGFTSEWVEHPQPGLHPLQTCFHGAYLLLSGTVQLSSSLVPQGSWQAGENNTRTSRPSAREAWSHLGKGWRREKGCSQQIKDILGEESTCAKALRQESM